jgi:hypothetical protein
MPFKSPVVEVEGGDGKLKSLGDVGNCKEGGSFGTSGV